MTISLSGLDMSWLNDPSKRLPDEHKQSARRAERRGKSFNVLPDLDQVYGEDGFISVIDGTRITSRAQLREHNKRHGVIQTGDVRGDQLRDKTKRHMRYNPELRNSPEFSWVEPRNDTSSGNLTEI